MKKINFLKIIIFLGLILNYSCKDTFDLDLTQNPNYLTNDQADPDYLLNSAQVNFAYFVERLGSVGARLTRIYHMSGRNYDAAYTPQSFDGAWSRAYAGIMKDLQVMEKIAEEKNLKHHMGIGKVLKAYTLMTLVDFFGDVPYSEALKDDILFPHPDSGADVYAAALDLLDSAIDDFNASAGAEPTDLYYGGDWDKWIKLANTLKMKAYLTTRLVDSDALNKFNAIMTAGDYIGADVNDGSSNDFEFRWSTNDINPDSRHPRYRATYTSTGGQDYQSNSFMDYMIGDDNATAYGGVYSPALSNHFDPRAWFYFYRQTYETPGQDGAAPDEQTLECSLIPAPPHYSGYAYCGLPRGYWGRDHGNDNGIPPDGFLRTLYGVYPAGGALDDFSYSAQKNGDGNGGNGITPIMLASWVQFMIAEYYMTQNDFANAKTYVFQGIELSMDKVFNFAPHTERFDIVLPTYFAPLDDYKNGLISSLSADWDNGTDEDKWNIWARQYFVALFGNGIDAYNAYRRTGYPHDLQPNLEPDPGPFIRSFYYPSNSVNNNPNMSQKPGVTVQVFWDNNPPSPGFPQSN